MHGSCPITCKSAMTKRSICVEGNTENRTQLEVTA